MNINTAKHKIQLGHIQDCLNAYQIPADYLEATNDAEIDVLVLPLPDNQEQQVLLGFLELPENDYTAIDLLQLHATISGELNLEHLSEVYLFVGQVNNYLPFGNLCVVNNTVCLRHIVPQARFENIKEGVLLDMLHLFLQVLGAVENTIHQLNTGQINHQEALAQFG